MSFATREAAWRSVCTANAFAQTKLLALSLLLLVALSVTANSATPIGQISGTVVDETGASVNGANVVLFGPAGSETQRSITDQRGRFSMDRVLAADYVVSVQK